MSCDFVLPCLKLQKNNYKEEKRERERERLNVKYIQKGIAITEYLYFCGI